MANVTFSADDELIRRARAYAQARDTTLNQLFREFLERMVGDRDVKRVAEEFAENCYQHAGKSEQSWRFNRNELHRRKSGGVA